VQRGQLGDFSFAWVLGMWARVLGRIPISYSYFFRTYAKRAQRR
jgi:hypothetical protein